MATLSNRALDAIKGNNLAMAKIMEFFDRSSQTIEIWLNKRPVDLRLTAPDAVKVISEATGLSPEEIITEQDETINV